MRHATIEQSLGYVHISAESVDKHRLPSPLRAVS